KRMVAVLTVLLWMGACAPTPSSSSGAQAPSKPAGAAASQTQPSPAQPTTVRVATSATGQNGYLVKVLQDRGLDVKHGFKIEPLFMDFTEAANALKLGRADVSIMQPSTA